MRNKLIAAGVGLVGYGAIFGWAVTADYYERKMKSNQRLLGDVIDRQARELNEARTLLLNDYSLEEIEERVRREILGETIIEEREHDNNQTDLSNTGSSEELDEVDGDPDSVGEDRSESSEQSDEDEDVDEAKTEELRAKLQGVINQYTSDEDSVNDLTELGVQHEIDRTPPYVISRSKYSWDEEEGDAYAKITLMYYPRERILLDDDNELVDDVAGLVGWRNLTRFGDESEDADVVFIRNRRLETDFEVVRDTENPPPAHILFGMGRDEFEVNKAAGILRFRPGDT